MGGGASTNTGGSCELESTPTSFKAPKEDVENIIRRTSLKEQESILRSKFSVTRLRSMSGSTGRPIRDDLDRNGASKLVGGFKEDVLLDKAKVLKLVNSLLIHSADKVRNLTIVTLFTNCLSADDEGLDYEDFCAMYEQISSRVELERIFSAKFAMYDIDKRGQIDKIDTIAITVYILANFAPIWCTKREIDEIKQKMHVMIESFPGECVSKLELLEVYDTMLISMRLIRDCNMKFKEIKFNSNGQLEEEDVVGVAMWMLKAYQRSGVRLVDDIGIKDELLAAHCESHDQLITINKLGATFESVKEKKISYYVLSKNADSADCLIATSHVPMVKRLSTHRFLDISPTQQEEIGINPIVHEKFDELDTAKKGYISKREVLELLHWMYLDRPEEEALYIAEIEHTCEGIDVDFDEFCSMFDDASLRIDQRKLFETAFRERSRGGKISYADLEGFLDACMFDAEKMGCSVADREDVKERLLVPFRPRAFLEGCTKEVLSDLYEEVCSMTRMLNRASKKFKELDKDGSGSLSGDELIALAEWYMQTLNQGPHVIRDSQLSLENRSVDSIELIKMRDKIMARFHKSSGDELTLSEMAVIYDELLASRRQEQNAMRYKGKVKVLVAELRLSNH